MPDSKSPIALLEEAVLLGGQAIVALLDSGAQVESTRKSDNSLVLNLDLASEGAMHGILSSAGIVVSEEDPASHALLSSGGSYFVSDPLDGTASCRRSLSAYGKFVPGQVGFGPLAGYVEHGRMVAAAFLNLPDRMLYSAVRGKGAFMVELAPNMRRAPGAVACQIQARPQSSLADSALLYNVGSREEVELAYYLKVNRVVDYLYRFGSFANDCTRVARGFEQIKIQFGPRAWDLAAALIASEAGCAAILDPLGKALLLNEWEVELRNSVCIVAPGLEHAIREVLLRFKNTPKPL
jgi:fructose-1,6-bisphosphatase/inositol monophosphatase family enzyme